MSPKKSATKRHSSARVSHICSDGSNSSISNPFPRNEVLRLNTALYGLKQSSWQWSLKLHDFNISLGYVQSEVDLCLYMLLQGDLVTYVAVYVDDLLIASNSQSEQVCLTSALSVAFSIEMRDVGFPSTFLVSISPM